MNYTDLVYFSTVVQCGSLTRAADQLHITQPSISKAIGRIEDDAGASLFTRTGNRIQLNYYGKIYYRAVLRALGTMESKINQVKDMGGRPEGNIRIGSTVSGILDKVLYQYHTAWPNDRIAQSMMAQELLADKLLSGEFDLTISAEPVIDSNIEWIPLLRDELYILVPPAHPLYQCGEAPLSAFTDSTFIVNNSGLLSNDDVLTLCHRAGFEPRLQYTGGEAEVIVRINTDHAVSFIPASTMERMALREDIPGSDMPLLDLKKACVHITVPSCQREYGLAMVRDRYRSAAVQRFRDMILDYFSQVQQRRNGEEALK